MNKKLLVIALIGAALGLAVGFGLYASFGAGQEFSLGLLGWIISRWDDSIVWAIGGAGVALGLRYITS
jgi:hypothetical protein